ncbi:MAG TPA: PIG-L family deacetylase [Anaerolineae bacterium]|nr:PIG-L family deacetylase [Anaerolineae bacterium]
MAETLKLMCILAHPDDESLGTGGILAKYAAEGVETYLITATRGERGWMGDEKDDPGPDALGRLRTGELQAAAQALGLREVHFLDYLDGDLDQADPAEAIAKIVTQLRRVRPHVVVTFDPFGAYGHPDHIAISQFTQAAIVAAADPTYGHLNGSSPHRVAKLYYMTDSKDLIAAYQSVMGDITMPVDGVVRGAMPWEDWAITTRIDTAAYWRQVWQAASCHRSQLPNHDELAQLPEEMQLKFWGCQTFYRAFSLVNGGRQVEHDLFEGLR